MSGQYVSSSKWSALYARMETLDIHDKVLSESFILASGSGGQKVNKSHSAVLLKHMPTGLFVKVSDSRYRELNRYTARVRLCDLICEQRDDIKSPKADRIEKKRRQKNRRARRSQDKYNPS